MKNLDSRWNRKSLALLAGIAFAAALGVTNASAFTCQDECAGGINAGKACANDGQCPGSTCDSLISPPCCDQPEETSSVGDCKCGDTLLGNVTLGHDITCSGGGNGLTLDTSNQVLDLNGFTIACDPAGPSCGTGVILDHQSATVKGGAGSNKGGRIEGFHTGVRYTGTSSGGTASQLTITDAGRSMTYGTYYVQKVMSNVISGAAAYGGAAIHLGPGIYCRITDNLVTDSGSGIAIAFAGTTPGGGSNCWVIHNRAVGNDYGFNVALSNFNTTYSVDNIFLNNSIADYSDTNTTNRLDAASNVCRLSPAGNFCSLSGMDFIP